MEEEVEYVQRAFSSDGSVKLYLERKNKEKQERNSSGLSDSVWAEIIQEQYTFTPLISFGGYSFWRQYIWSGVLDFEALDCCIRKDLEALTPKESESDVLHILNSNYWELDEVDFYNKMNTLIKSLLNGKYTNICAIVTAYSLYMHFIDMDAPISLSFDNIDEFFEDVLKATNIDVSSFLEVRGNLRSSFEFISYKGYSHNEIHSIERVKEFTRKVMHYAEDEYNESLKKEFFREIEAVKRGDTAPEHFIDMIIHENTSNKNEYYRSPCLTWIVFDDLWCFVSKQSLISQLTFIGSLSERYGLMLNNLPNGSVVYAPEISVIRMLANEYKRELDNAMRSSHNRVIMLRRLYTETEKLHERLSERLQVH